MSKRRKVINAYRPRIELGSTVKMDELVSHIKENSPFSTGTIRGVMIDLHDAIVHFNLSGRAVKVEGLGVFSPDIGKVCHVPFFLAPCYFGPSCLSGHFREETLSKYQK